MLSQCAVDPWSVPSAPPLLGASAIPRVMGTCIVVVPSHLFKHLCVQPRDLRCELELEHPKYVWRWVP